MRRSSVILAAALLLTGCAASRAARLKQAEKLCGPEIPGSSELLTPGAFVLFGEMHGTNEIPYVVGELACHASALRQTVSVAIEVGAQEQALLDGYLASAGTPDDQRRLFAGTFWNRPYQDGRSSKAVAAMLEQLRRLRSAGLAIRVVAYDTPGLEGSEHGRGMAENLLADRAAHPQDTYLVLCGNVQARTVVGTEWDPELIPMGVYLRKAIRELKALDADYAPGQAWTCRPPLPLQCGVQPVVAPRRTAQLAPVQPPNNYIPAEPFNMTPVPQRTFDPSGGFRGYRPFVRLSTTPSAEGYDGIFYVGPITPSPPAAVASLGSE